MIRRFLEFLGPGRTWALFGLIALTGLISLMLNAVPDRQSVLALQNLLLLAALIGAPLIILSAMQPYERGRRGAILFPAIGALILAITVLPQFALALLGGAVGWVVAGLFIFRARAPMQYQRAVRHFRKNRYPEAVKELDELIKVEPDNPNHYQFRAQLLRVWGKLDRARRDYQKMTELAPDSAPAFNGLSEVLMQMGNYRAALDAAQRAAQLAPDDWVTYYNLGMIEDRLRQSPQVVEHLTRAGDLRVRDARHRALIQFYLARAYARLGDFSAAETAAAHIDPAGLKEWHKLLESDQAETLRAVLGADIETARQLQARTLDVAALAETGV